MSQLDERLRGALRDAADAEEPVDAGAGEVAGWLAREGGREIRRARVRRQVGAAAAVALAAAVPLAIWLATPDDVDAPEVAERAPAPEAPEEAAPDSVAPAAPRACERRPVGLTTGPVTARRDVGFVAFEPSGDARVAVVEASGCALRLRLDEGAVTVHARDLGGGTLQVETPDALVTVHGTIFRVSLEPEAAVSVAEGRVSVRTEDGEVFLDGGASWRDGRVVSADGATLRAEVEAWSAAPEVVAASRPRPRRRAPDVAPTPEAQDPDTLAIRAEAARRQGDLATARELYRQAGAGRGPTSEGAWIRLARMELDAGDPRAARRALTSRARFGEGVFGAEAGWLLVQVREAAGDTSGAVAAARRVLARHAGTPQARAAQRWLDAHAP